MSCLAHGNYFHFIGPLKSCTVHTKMLYARVRSLGRASGAVLSVSFLGWWVAMPYIFSRAQGMKSTNPRLPFGFRIHKQLSKNPNRGAKMRMGGGKRNEKINTLCKKDNTRHKDANEIHYSGKCAVKIECIVHTHTLTQHSSALVRCQNKTEKQRDNCTHFISYPASYANIARVIVAGNGLRTFVWCSCRILNHKPWSLLSKQQKNVVFIQHFSS